MPVGDKWQGNLGFLGEVLQTSNGGLETCI